MPDNPEGKALLASLKMAHHQWLSDVQTQKFFESLRARLADWQNKATNASVTGGKDREHDYLVRSAELLTLLNEYADPSKYPYTSQLTVTFNADSES